MLQLINNTVLCRFTGQNHQHKYSLFDLLNWLICLVKCDQTCASSVILAYDNMCNLCKLKAGRDPLPFEPPFDKIWLNVTKVIDSFHFRNHIDPQCKEKYSPALVKSQNLDFNTMAGEQTFVWVSRFKHIICAMNKSHHLFYLHRMVRRRNKYTYLLLYIQHCFFICLAVLLIFFFQKKTQNTYFSSLCNIIIMIVQ